MSAAYQTAARLRNLLHCESVIAQLIATKQDVLPAFVLQGLVMKKGKYQEEIKKLTAPKHGSQEFAEIAVRLSSPAPAPVQSDDDEDEDVHVMVSTRVIRGEKIRFPQQKKAFRFDKKQKFHRC